MCSSDRSYRSTDRGLIGRDPPPSPLATTLVIQKPGHQPVLGASVPLFYTAPQDVNMFLISGTLTWDIKWPSVPHDETLPAPSSLNLWTFPRENDFKGILAVRSRSTHCQWWDRREIFWRTPLFTGWMVDLTFKKKLKFILQSRVSTHFERLIPQKWYILFLRNKYSRGR